MDRGASGDAADGSGSTQNRIDAPSLRWPKKVIYDGPDLGAENRITHALGEEDCREEDQQRQRYTGIAFRAGGDQQTRDDQRCTGGDTKQDQQAIATQRISQRQIDRRANHAEDADADVGVGQILNAHPFDQHGMHGTPTDGVANRDQRNHRPCNPDFGDLVAANIEEFHIISVLV